MTPHTGSPTTATSQYGSNLSKGEKVIALLILLAFAAAVAGGGIYIIVSPHAAQKQPVIAHLYQDAPKDTATTGTPRRLVGQLPATDRCRPPQEQLRHNRIRRRARQSGHAVWLLVHEGDRDAMMSAVARSAEQHGGYAARNSGALTPGNVIGIMAPHKWSRDHLDQLRPYERRPNPAKSGDQVSDGYPA